MSNIITTFLTENASWIFKKYFLPIMSNVSSLFHPTKEYGLSQN